MRNFKSIFVAVMLIAILTMSIFLCSCKKDNEDKEDEIVEPYSLALTQFYLKDQNPHITDYFDDESKLNLAEKINSVEELKTFCQEKQLKVFDETDNTIKYDSVSKRLRAYGEDFFKKRSIVLVFRFNETADFHAKSVVDINDGVMNIDLTTYNGNATTAVRTYISIYELSKEVSQEVTQINVKESLGELDQKIGIRIYEDCPNSKNDAPTSFIINSIEELNEFCNEETSPYFEPSEFSQNINKRIIGILSKYDEEFFQEKSIIILFRGRSSGMFFYRFKDFEIKDDSINITLSRKLPEEPGWYSADFIICVYILEFDKEQIANVKQINVNEIEE